MQAEWHDYLMMIIGASAMSYGFYLVGERKGAGGWYGVLLLYVGFVLAFLTVLLAFAPKFFE